MNLVAEMGPLDCVAAMAVVLLAVTYAVRKGWRRG